MTRITVLGSKEMAKRESVMEELMDGARLYFDLRTPARNVCQYFLRGKCSFGDNCRNEHPQGGDKQSAFGSSGFNPTGGGFGSNRGVVNYGPPLFTKESIKKDLTEGVEKPLWPLTSYGPAKCDPTLVTELDESAEELRVKGAEAFKAGSMNEYMKYEADKIAAANQAYTQLLGNVDQIYDLAVQRKTIPSGVIPENTSAFGGGSAFGQPSASSSFGGGSVFGGGSAFGSTPTAGTSAFGQSSLIQPGTGAFGQLSSFGGGGGSAFGGGSSGSAFGQPSVIKPASGTFGSSGGGAFGAFTGSGSGAFSAFSGAPSAFGAGAPNTTGGSAFGQSSFGASAPAAGGSAFGAPAPATSVFGTPVPATSAFGTPAPATSTFGAPAQETPSAFGASATNTSAFGAPAPATSAFSQPSVFGAPAQPTNTTSSAFGGSAFGSAVNASATPNPLNPSGSVFGGASVFNQGTGSSAFGQPSNEPKSVFSTFSNPTTSAFGVPTNTNSGSVFSNSLPPKPPPGPPSFTNISPSPYKPGISKYDMLLPENYLSLLPVAVKAAFESSKFEWGTIPEWVPPKELR